MPNITSGIYKNRNLLTPSSFLNKNNIRPTANYTKQLIMNLIKNGNVIPGIFKIESSIIADICCGTGAVGFELISNGAKHCYFIDSNNIALSYIKETARSLGIIENITTNLSMTNLRKMECKLDLIFIDPPYQQQDLILGNFINIASKSTCITNKTIIIAETYKDLSKDIEANGCEILINREGVSKTFIVGFKLNKE